MLLEEIKELREKLKNELESKEINHKEILKISQELDQFIKKYKKMKNNN